jgi:hypothetical protein
MSRSDILVRRAAPVLLVAVAGLFGWVAIAIVTPYAITHPPGPQNPSFSWYMLYHSFPPLFLLALLLTLGPAWTLWRRGNLDFGFGRSIARSPLMLDMGVKSTAGRYALFVAIVAIAVTAAVVASFFLLLISLALLAAIHG